MVDKKVKPVFNCPLSPANTASAVTERERERRMKDTAVLSFVHFHVLEFLPKIKTIFDKIGGPLQCWDQACAQNLSCEREVRENFGKYSELTNLCLADKRKRLPI